VFLPERSVIIGIHSRVYAAQVLGWNVHEGTDAPFTSGVSRQIRRKYLQIYRDSLLLNPLKNYPTLESSAAHWSVHSRPYTKASVITSSCNLLTNNICGVETFLRSHQLLNYWRISQNVMEPKGSLSYLQEPARLRPSITFHNKLFLLYGEEWTPRPTPSWRTNLCLLSAAVSQLPTLSRGRLLRPQR
jgi:hypothetical protein